ncbi:hypothetical protein V1506DRAFT_552663 [Lipomyces tetrasporus]
MAERRSAGRNVHIYQSSAPEEALGGLLLNQSVTAKCFLLMLDILLAPSDTYEVSWRGSNVVLSASDQPLQPGDYDVIPISPEGKIVVTDEPCILRVYSGTSTQRLEEFRSQVRARDGKLPSSSCFPTFARNSFRQSGLSEFITNRTGEEDSGINSCQNGLLMQPTIHQLFASFDISINADDNYKVVCFRLDAFGMDGRILDPVCRNPHDERSIHIPPGTDMVGEILSGPQPAERMETEILLGWRNTNSRYYPTA